MRPDHLPEVRLRHEDGLALSARFWRLPEPMLAISSAPLGGGVGLRQWVLNVQVPHDYDCAEPAPHLAALATEVRIDRPRSGHDDGGRRAHRLDRA